MFRICKNILFSIIVLSAGCIIVILSVRPAFSISLQSVPIILKASEIIPNQWLKGPNYTIKERVNNDGIASTYELDTYYGPIIVEGTALLLKRMHQLRALHRMEQLRSTDVFAKATREAAKGTFYTAKGLIKDPLDTLSAVGSGIGRFFSRVASESSSDNPYQASTLMSVLGHAETKREFAHKFGVDPYSSYAPIQKTLDSLSWTATAGSLAAKTAFSLAPGGAVSVVSITSASDSLRSLVRDKTPSELQEINIQKLSTMGVSEPIAKLFLNNANYNPFEQTLLVGELANMKTVQQTGQCLLLQLATLRTSKWQSLCGPWHSSWVSTMRG